MRPVHGLVLLGALGATSCSGGELDAGTRAPSPARTSISSGGASVFESEPTLARLTDGTLVAAWMSIATTPSLGFARSRDGGVTWTEPSAVVTPGGRLAADPVLVEARSGGVWLAWAGFREVGEGQIGDTAIFVAHAAAGGELGEPAIVEQSPDALLDKPWLVSQPDGRVLATWAHAPSADTSTIHAATSADGVAWPIVTLSDASFAYRNLAATCQSPAGGAIFAVWWQADGIRLRRSDDGGKSWSGDVIASAPGESPAFDPPSCATDGQTVWVEYGLSSDPVSEASLAMLHSIRLARSDDRGATIASRDEAHDPAFPFFLDPQLARGASSPVLTYYGGKGEGDAAGTFRLGRPGLPSVALTGPLPFTAKRSGTAWLGDYQGVLVAEGDLFAAYVDATDGNAHVRFARARVP